MLRSCSPASQIVVQRLERDAAARAARAARGAGARADVREVLRLALVLDDAHELAGGRRVVESSTSTGSPASPRPPSRRGSRTARAPCRTRRPRRQRRRAASAVHEHRRDRPRPTSRRDSTTTPDASAPGFARRSSSASATRRIFSSRSAMLSFCFAETAENCVVAPVLGLEALGGELRLHAVDVRVGHVHLVDGHDDRHRGGAGVRDRLLRHRHDAVVRRDDEHRDVGALRPRARMAVNASWPGVSRNVMRRPPTSAWYAPMCCVIPGLGLDDCGLADGVEERRLAVSTWPMIVTTGGRGARSSSCRRTTPARAPPPQRA